MVKDELGSKRTCPSCAARFYDLMKSPIQCPKCGTSFTAEVVLPSKGEGGAPVKMRPAPEPEVEETPDVEIVSLEEVEEPGGDEDEAAAIPDVDLGEDVAVEDEEDVFLEEEEDGGNVSGIIGGGGAEEEEP